MKLTKLPRERFAEEWTGVTLFMAPSPDYKPHKDQKMVCSLYPYISETAWLDFQYRFGNTLGDPD